MPKQYKTIDSLRVKIAREAAGLSKVQLAGILGVDPRTINTFENEGAPAKHAGALAAATNRPLGFFTDQPFEAIEVDQVLFRAAKRIAKKTKAISTSYGAIGLWLYSELLSHFKLPAVDVPTLDSLSPESAAQRVRILWQLREDPLPNLVQLFESRGIRVLSLPLSIQKLDAFSYWYADGAPYIFLNTSKTAERVRFDMAHELGHLVLHSRVTDTGRDLEKEADRFAAEFLMPARAIHRDMRPYADVAEIIRLKRQYRVSALAMNYRGGELGILKEWGQRQNYVELTQLGYRASEPDGLELDRSRIIPFVLGRLREKGFSMAQFAAEAGVTLQDLNGFLFGEVLAPVAPTHRTDWEESQERHPKRPTLKVLS